MPKINSQNGRTEGFKRLTQVCRIYRLSNVAVFLAELRRPKGPPSRTPYPYREEKETHELIFSWLSWLAVLLVGAYGRRRRQELTGKGVAKKIAKKTERASAGEGGETVLNNAVNYS